MCINLFTIEAPSCAIEGLQKVLTYTEVLQITPPRFRVGIAAFYFKLRSVIHFVFIFVPVENYEVSLILLR